VTSSHGAAEALFARPVRPRSVRVHEAAVAAARQLLSEGGLRATTMDAISIRSADGRRRTPSGHDTATDLLFGPLVFRLMAGHLPLTDNAAAGLASAALHGLLAEKET
jgi:hypothetical protein